MKNLFNLLIAALMITAVSCNSNNKPKDSTEAATDTNEKKLDAKDSTEVVDDAKYAVEAANGGMLEVELGKLAQNKAISPAVMKFANMMVADHTKANNELKTLAASKKISLPTTLGEKFQKDYDDFSKMKREDFDKAYTDYMVKDHKEDIEEFKKEANDGKDPDLKAFANKHVPILEHHLLMAQQANDAVKNKK
ncbi:MAG: outer membrane protein-like protein [Mucilaginibacter sp.]|nr:outer membrane protein-like protein [Mucilaginibacter sp.]